jgi:hypothetical protein
MNCRKCKNKNVIMMIRTEVEFPVDENGDIYINDYEGYDDLLEQCLRERNRNKKYWCGMCGNRWEVR